MIACGCRDSCPLITIHISKASLLLVSQLCLVTVFQSMFFHSVGLLCVYWIWQAVCHNIFSNQHSSKEDLGWWIMDGELWSHVEPSTISCLSGTSPHLVVNGVLAVRHDPYRVFNEFDYAVLRKGMSIPQLGSPLTPNNQQCVNLVKLREIKDPASKHIPAFVSWYG